MSTSAKPAPPDAPGDPRELEAARRNQENARYLAFVEECLNRGLKVREITPYESWPGRNVGSFSKRP